MLRLDTTYTKGELTFMCNTFSFLLFLSNPKSSSSKIADGQWLPGDPEHSLPLAAVGGLSRSSQHKSFPGDGAEQSRSNRSWETRAEISPLRTHCGGLHISRSLCGWAASPEGRGSGWASCCLASMLKRSS